MSFFVDKYMRASQWDVRVPGCPGVRVSGCPGVRLPGCPAGLFGFARVSSLRSPTLKTGLASLALARFARIP